MADPDMASAAARAGTDNHRRLPNFHIAIADYSPVHTPAQQKSRMASFIAEPGRGSCVPCGPGADMELLPRLRQARPRSFKSKAAPERFECLVASKFVSGGAAMYYKLRNRGTKSTS